VVGLDDPARTLAVLHLEDGHAEPLLSRSFDILRKSL
jgi:hypothetical protein